jgi:hypothetical protein
VILKKCSLAKISGKVLIEVLLTFCIPIHRILKKSKKVQVFFKTGTKVSINCSENILFAGTLQKRELAKWLTSNSPHNLMPHTCTAQNERRQITIGSQPAMLATFQLIL